ncbi:hypothetical protein ncot_01300 [Nocardioides sp. JQ2195]|uniref:hypothetical protein n=1 Tax=Nocardioides sp. JQ2195 TaxID=2592334 RepID=UPI00143ED4C9|nr:hypothetical protein [Nocardioides sp. JQ2195]QIX25373.1 hypothetical protein ncot_01300 [Nocardioides sp. JQ2195]
MSVSLVVDGSPSGCRAASTEIRRLANQVGDACDMLAKTMIAACGAWSGSSSDAFTDFAKERINRADELHEELLLFALAMEAFGLGLADVKSEMKRAKGIAVGHGIVVSTLLPEVGEITLDPGQEGPLDHAVGVANRAREHEQRLQLAWQQSLSRASRLVWDPAEVDAAVVSAGTSLSGPVERLRDLAPDLPDLTPGPVDVTGLLQGARDQLPSLPDIGNVDLMAQPMVYPSILVPLMAIKASKRAFPEQAGTLDSGIRKITKIVVPKAAMAGCRLTPVTAPLSPLCGVVGGVAAGPVGDEIVEMTDAR